MNADVERTVKVSCAFVFSDRAWDRISEAHGGTTTFTFTVPRDDARGLRLRTACIVVAYDREANAQVFIGFIVAKSVVSAVDTRIRVSHCGKGDDASLRVIPQFPEMTQERNVIAKSYSPRQAEEIYDALYEFAQNKKILDRLSQIAFAPTTFEDATSLQANAIATALKIFGMSNADVATSVTTTDFESGVQKIRLNEDSVIEHDARWIPGLDLVDSTMTGKATFEKNAERLEVYTANKKPLEELFGVDLIYFNVRRESIVMVQYKMLELVPGAVDAPEEWRFRPDDQFDKELESMKRVASDLGVDPYRLNSDPFYFKFVRRNASVLTSSVVISLGHYLHLEKGDKLKGPRGGLRLDYQTLDGHYLWATTFIQLVRSGYIGSTRSRTAEFKALLDAASTSGRALVVAIESSIKRAAAV